MENKMEKGKINRLIWQMGIPMIISMVLQALYNIVDTAFVINIPGDGVNANLALTYAFPIQILLIAVGVGTGIGINTLLSKFLGEGKNELASKVCGSAIFIGICIYLIFLLFGIFGSEAFIRMQAKDNINAISFGKNYLTIVSTLSLGAIGYTIYERFLQASGRTLESTIAQITGALLNIVLDYIFIYPMNLGVSGAAYATVIGQFASLFVAMLFHYIKNKNISNNPKYLLPDFKIIKEIYKIGIPAMIMQGLLSVMMLGINIIIGFTEYNRELLSGAFGIYYKIQQLALFASFGLSNTLITLVSFNYGLKNKERINDCIKYGIINSIIVSLFITILFEALATPLSLLFGLASGSSTEIVDVTKNAIRIASIGYVFMGISVAIQGILQALRLVFKPLIISLLRLVIFLFPLAYIFVIQNNNINIFWFIFPLAELLTTIISIIFIITTKKKIVNNIQ